MLEETLRELHSELPSNVALVAVSKFHPQEMIVRAYHAGQRIFAESRPQELQQKALALATEMPDIHWHFIGHLQTNKLKMVLPYVELVQSVDSLRLLQAIQNWAVANDRKINVLLELHVAAEETKQGFTRDEVVAVLDAYNHTDDFDHVEICGLMGMATFTDDEHQVRSDFSRIHAVFEAIRQKWPEMHAFKELSIGMSGDYKIALEYGSTMVRIGTKIFGSRV